MLAGSCQHAFWNKLKFRCLSGNWPWRSIMRAHFKRHLTPVMYRILHGDCHAHDRITQYFEQEMSLIGTSPLCHKQGKRKVVWHAWHLLTLRRYNMQDLLFLLTEVLPKAFFPVKRPSLLDFQSPWPSSCENSRNPFVQEVWILSGITQYPKLFIANNFTWDWIHFY